MANKHIEKCFALLFARTLQIKGTMRYNVYCKMAKATITDNTKHWRVPGTTGTSAWK